MSLKVNLGFSEFFLRMGNPSSREVYEFDDFRLDAGHLMLYHGGEELPLAPKAVETLLALVERRGTIVSKDELLEAVWPDAIVEESNLFLYLSILRKTLGTQKNGKPWVETLRRRGYRFASDAQRLAKDPRPDNAHALRLFIKGQFYVRKLKAPDIELGIEFLRQAIDVDPSYAMAYSGLAEAYRSLALAGEVPPQDPLHKAREAALTAVELDDSLAEGHCGLGSAAYLSDWNWTQAEKHYLRALELNANSASTHLYYAEFLFRTGRLDEWRAHSIRASELEPHSPFINVFAASAFSTKENPDGALNKIKAVTASDPDFYFPHLIAGRLYRRQQMYAESLAAYRRAKELSSDQTWSDCGMFETLLNMGKMDEARELLGDLLTRSRSRFVPPFHVALMYSMLDDRDQAFRYLEEAYSIRDPKLTFLYVDLRLGNLRSDDRYNDLLRRVGFPTPETHS